MIFWMLYGLAVCNFIHNNNNIHPYRNLSWKYVVWPTYKAFSTDSWMYSIAGYRTRYCSGLFEFHKMYINFTLFLIRLFLELSASDQIIGATCYHEHWAVRTNTWFPDGSLCWGRWWVQSLLVNIATLTLYEFIFFLTARRTIWFTTALCSFWKKYSIKRICWLTSSGSC